MRNSSQSTSKYFNNLKSICPIDELSTFTSMLYHDNKAGYACVGEKWCGSYSQDFHRVGKLKTSRFFDTSADYYISLNTFMTKSRRVDNLYSKSVFYIDIDLHGLGVDDQDFHQVTQALTEAYEKKFVSIPTAITFSGRGFGIYYVLEKSINCNVESTKKMRYLFDLTYRQLIVDYAKILKNCKKAEVDKAVLDGSRIARVPSTMNTKAGKVCHLIFLNKDADGNVKYVKNFKEVAKVAKDDVNKKAIIFNKNSFAVVAYSNDSTILMLQQRIQKLFKLAKLRHDSKYAYRELTLHMAYNFAIQAGYDEEKAKGVVRSLNSIYDCPLPERELKAAVSSVTKEHTYNYTTKQIAEKLQISKEENEIVGFHESVKRIITRAQDKRDNQVNKVNRNYEIACYIQLHPDVTIIKVAELFSVSRSTVNNIIKDFGVNRNQCKNFVAGDVDDVKKQKVQKFDAILWCVIENDSKRDQKDEFSYKENTNKENTHKGITNKENTNKENTHKGNTNKENTYKGNTNKENTHKENTYKGNTNKENTHKENTNKEYNFNLDFVYENFLKAYNMSYLNYLTEHTNDHNNFQTFINRYESFISDTSKSNFKKRVLVIQTVNAIGHVFAQEPNLESSKIALDFIASVMTGEHRLTITSKIPIQGVTLKSLSMRDVIEEDNDDYQFFHSPIFVA